MRTSLVMVSCTMARSDSLSPCPPTNESLSPTPSLIATPDAWSPAISPRASPAAVDVFPDSNGWTDLHFACEASRFQQFYSLDILQTLVPYASVSAINEHTHAGKPIGWSALHLAASNSDVYGERAAMVKLLIDARADIECVDQKGNTPLHKAASTGHFGAAQHLVQARANCSARNAAGKTPAEMASRSNAEIRCFTLESAVQDSKFRLQ